MHEDSNERGPMLDDIAGAESQYPQWYIEQRAESHRYMVLCFGVGLLVGSILSTFVLVYW